jgi:hypothetical protein
LIKTKRGLPLGLTGGSVAVGGGENSCDIQQETKKKILFRTPGQLYVTKKRPKSFQNQIQKRNLDEE